MGPEVALRNTQMLATANMLWHSLLLASYPVVSTGNFSRRLARRFDDLKLVSTQPHLCPVGVFKALLRH